MIKFTRAKMCVWFMCVTVRRKNELLPEKRSHRLDVHLNSIAINSLNFLVKLFFGKKRKRNHTVALQRKKKKENTFAMFLVCLF